MKLGPLDTAPRLTLLILLLLPELMGDRWYFYFPLASLAVLGLAAPPLHRSPWLWGGIALVLTCKTIPDWWTQDNHRFLLNYWAIALTLGFARGGETIASNARLLLGASFALAVLWKGLLSPDFLDGTYFHYVFLADARFHDALSLIGGSDDLIRAQNLELARSFAAGAERITLVDRPATVWLARGVTAWTLLIETALAVCFLWPPGGWPSRVRHYVLLTFASTTYLVATVLSFGWILLSLGVAQVEPERPGLVPFYLGACGLLLVYAFVPLLG